MASKEFDMFAEQRPYTGEVCDVDCDGGFARVPEHVDGRVNVLEVEDFS